MKIAILVSEKYYDQPTHDDLLLKEKLDEKGATARLVQWDDASIDYENFDKAIIRSCWDYHLKADLFVSTMHEVSKKCQLINNFDLIVENTNKTYLQKFYNKGIEIVPTHYIHSLSELESLALPFDANEYIVKPAISSSGNNTFKVSCDDIIGKARDLLDFGSVLIQPFIRSVQDIGERSTVVIDGCATFTMKKTPSQGGFLVHTHHGGSYIEVDTRSEDALWLEKVIKGLPVMPAYARVDYLYSELGSPLLLELELIEPNLYLSQNRAGLERLVNFIIKAE